MEKRACIPISMYMYLLFFRRCVKKLKIMIRKETVPPSIHTLQKCSSDLLLAPLRSLEPTI